MRVHLFRAVEEHDPALVCSNGVAINQVYSVRNEVERPLVCLEPLDEVIAPEVVVRVPLGVDQRRRSVVGLQISSAYLRRICRAPPGRSRSRHRRTRIRCRACTALVVAELVPSHRVRPALRILAVLLLAALINRSQRRIGVRRVLLG